MPVYDYRCKECGATYDVYHKVRETTDDVTCPSCNSKAHVRLMSAVSVGTTERGSRNETASSCATGSCCGGSCGLN